MNSKTMNDTYSSGFSIIELILVLTIIGTLLAIAIPSFNQMQRKARTESQVKEMVTDISELRVRAMTHKQRHSITLNANSYVFRSYSSDEEPQSSGTIIPSGNRIVANRLVRVNGGASTLFSGQLFEIDHRGLVSSNLTPPWSAADFVLLENNSSPSIDCFKLEAARTNVGKANAAWSNCDDK